MRITTRTILSGILTLGLLTFTTACGTDTKEATTDDKLNLVATTTMLADLAEVIGGDAITVTGLMGVGVDPHLYKASAGDVSKLENAQIILYNGLHLEGEMTDIFAKLETDSKTILSVGDSLDETLLLMSEEEGELYDPHIWFDVSVWKEVATKVAQMLIELDDNNKELYSNNLEGYLVELSELEEYINNRTMEVPESQRVIITAHDAFNYLGNAYGFEVRGLQGISTEAETSTGDISSLASYIVERQIKAVFVESSVPTKNMEALQEAVKAKNFQIEMGGELYSDSLGDESKGHDTYIATFKYNIDTIVEALK